jgi:hypothetical protein
MGWEDSGNLSQSTPLLCVCVWVQEEAICDMYRSLSVECIGLITAADEGGMRCISTWYDALMEQEA